MIQDEGEAIRQCQRGEVAGLEWLVAHYQHAAAQLALLLTGDRFLAEDITQESFLTAFRTLRNFRVGQPFKPWLFGIVTNTARNARRRASQRHEVSLSRVADEVGAMPAAHDPAEVAERREAREAMLQALDALGPKQREAVVLRYYFGLKDTEIAAVVGCRDGAARERVSAGLKSLAAIIKERFPWLFRDEPMTLFPTTPDEEVTYDAIQRRA